MKKLTLLAAAAAVAMSANAQYVVADAGLQPVLDKGENAAVFYTFLLDQNSIAELKKAGKTVHEYATNDETRWLYIWDNTFIAGDGTAPGVDFQTDGHVALSVGTVGWSGAGFNQNKDGVGMDFSGLSDETRLHLGYSAASNPVKSIGITLLDRDKKNADDKNEIANTPAHFSIGTPFVDGGETWPSVGAAPTDEWQAVDISFADLKKLYPKFAVQPVSDWTGNYLAFLCGSVTGQNIEFDAFYFYQPKGESGISNIEMGKAEIVVTGKTVSASGAKHIALYDLTGKTVKAVDGSILGLNGVPAGLYLVKADNSVRKVLVK